MKNHLSQYLRKLSKSGIGLDFYAVTCRYKKFTMYCLLGPEENILHLTFARDKHGRLQSRLRSLDSRVRIKTLEQKKFPFNAMFADYFAGRLTRLPMAADSPLLAAGTDFQKRVWRHIGAIPYGRNITYRELAELAGSPKGSRAVGTACGANPVSLLIPCHRVVAVNGLGGFAGGLVVKKALLALEQRGSRAAA